MYGIFPILGFPYHVVSYVIYGYLYWSLQILRIPWTLHVLGFTDSVHSLEITHIMDFPPLDFPVSKDSLFLEFPEHPYPGYFPFWGFPYLVYLGDVLGILRNKGSLGYP